MPSLESSMDSLESHLQILFEGGMARLFPSRSWQFELAQAVTSALSDEAKLEQGGKVIAPDHFTIFLNQDQFSWFEGQQGVVDALAVYLTQAAQEAGYTFRAAPKMRILPKPEEGDGKMQVVAQFTMERSGQTASLSFPHPKAYQPTAFLIVDGIRLFTISSNVTNIGRLEENHLVINDGRVSRRHAQLRLVHAKYMIFDLDSSGGTFVNGRRIMQYSLHPGDVISLAGVPLVFGLETSENAAQTQEITPAKD